MFGEKKRERKPETSLDYLHPSFFSSLLYLSLRSPSRSSHVALISRSRRDTSSFSARIRASVVRESRRSHPALSRFLCFSVRCAKIGRGRCGAVRGKSEWRRDYSDPYV